LSTHAIPAGIDLERARVLATRLVRAPSGIVYGNGEWQPPTAIEFTPDLTPAEQAILAEIVQRCRATVTWSDEDWATFKAAYPVLKAFRTRPSAATLAQTQAVLDRVIDCLAAMVRTE
jgi:hypothetical protein